MRTAIAGLAALLGATLGACGSTPLSLTQLRSSATRVCGLAQRQGAGIPGPAPSATGAPSAAAGARFLRSGIVVLRRERTELQTLRPPSGQRSQYHTALAALSDQLHTLQATQQRLAAGEDPVVAIKLLQQQLTPLEESASSAWQSLGIPACTAQ